MSRLCLLFVTLGLFLFCDVIALDDALHVTLSHGGSLVGIKLVSEKSRDIRSFLGVPYAKPPVGSLRFEVMIIEN